MPKMVKIVQLRAAPVIGKICDPVTLPFKLCIALPFVILSHCATRQDSRKAFFGRDSSEKEMQGNNECMVRYSPSFTAGNLGAPETTARNFGEIV
jgi:hypothetical protein